MEREFLEITDFLNEQKVLNFMQADVRTNKIFNLDELHEHASE